MSPLVQVSAPADGVALLLQDSGGRNFSSFAASDELLAALQQVRADGARVVVVGSAVPGHFVGHGWLPDLLETFTGGTPSGNPLAGWSMFEELDTGPLISIAAVDGEAWGHGAELAWACDLRVASTRASFGQPEVAAGTIPGSGGTVRLRRLVGEAATLGLVLDGRAIDAAEAHRLGLVHRLVPDGRAVAEAVAWASELARRPEGALATVKEAVKGARGLGFDEALRREQGIFVERLRRADVLDRLREIQSRYDAGGDTVTAFELGGPDDPSATA